MDMLFGWSLNMILITSCKKRQWCLGFNYHPFKINSFQSRAENDIHFPGRAKIRSVMLFFRSLASFCVGRFSAMLTNNEKPTARSFLSKHVLIEKSRFKHFTFSLIKPLKGLFWNPSFNHMFMSSGKK